MITDTNRVFLSPAEYIDSDHPAILAEAGRICGSSISDISKARAIYYSVRDILYLAADFSDLESYRASSVLSAGHGYCVAKASLFTALCRAAGLPARIWFADVSNHLATPDVSRRMGNIFAWHGFSEVYVDGRWVKACPAFNASMCQKFGVAPLEFDGKSDALLHPFDKGGNLFMSYEKNHGYFHDVPAKFLATEMEHLYPETCAAIRRGEFPLPKDFNPTNRY